MRAKKQVTYLKQNLKLLRERKGKNQEDLASDLGIKRSKYNSYENGVALNPPIDILHCFSKYFGISADSLLWTNLKPLSETQLRNLEEGNDEFITGTNIRVLATTIDIKNKENIEIVPIKAKAGYTAGFSDPHFIERLPSFQLPVLNNHRKYRMFQIEGDSMVPIPDKSFVIGEYQENWFEIKNNQAYIVLTKDEGIVFKEVTNNLKKDRTLLMHSLNPAYKDYSVKASDVSEVWKFVSYFSDQIPDIEVDSGFISKYLNEIRNDIGVIMNKINA